MIGYNDPSAVGAVIAARAAGKELTVVGLNGTSDGIDGVKNGRLRGDRAGRLDRHRRADGRGGVSLSRSRTGGCRRSSSCRRARDEGQRQLDPELAGAAGGDQVDARGERRGGRAPAARHRGRPQTVTEDPILQARALHKRYGGVHALRGARIAVYPGEVHALVGENGSGKSTMLKILSGQIRADAGEVSLAGRPERRSATPRTRSAGHRDRDAGDDACARPLDRGERLPRAPHGAPRAVDRLARHPAARPGGAAPAGPRPRSVAARAPAATGPAADGRDRPRALDRRARPHPRRADELAHRRRGGLALRARRRAAGRGRRDDLRLAPAERGVRDRRSVHGAPRRATRWARRPPRSSTGRG